MEVLIRHYLAVEPAGELDVLLDQYAAALWLEERQMAVMTAAMAKAFGGGKG
jgi:hypothetical protein